MRFTATFLVSLCLMAGPVFAAAPSEEKKGEDPAAVKPAVKRGVPETLMFSIDELNEIQSRTSSGDDDGPGGRADAIESAALYLSTIVFYGPTDWTIWVNGVAIGPNQEFSAFKVLDIGPRFVELLVPLSAQGMRPVRLSPNQSFVAKSGAVVEGPWKQ